MRLPAILVPYPDAADNHQFFNAQAWVETGAARMLDQQDAMPEVLLRLVGELVRDHALRESIRTALAQWHQPDAAEQIVTQMFEAMARNGVLIPPSARHDPPAATGNQLLRRAGPLMQSANAEIM